MKLPLKVADWLFGLYPVTDVWQHAGAKKWPWCTLEPAFAQTTLTGVSPNNIIMNTASNSSLLMCPDRSLKGSSLNRYVCVAGYIIGNPAINADTGEPLDALSEICCCKQVQIDFLSQLQCPG